MSNEINNYSLTRKEYGKRYGPTQGDKVRLGDTSIIIEIEHDFATYGDELTLDFGGTVRDGLGQMPGSPGVVFDDTVLVNAIVFDANKIVKADIGIKNGLITRIGKAGNPDSMDGVTIPVGVSTTVIDMAGLIVTPGSIATNMCFTSIDMPRALVTAGVTTAIGGLGNSSMAACSGTYSALRFLDELDEAPLNFVLTGNFSESNHLPVNERFLFGAGLIHDIRGATPAVIDFAATLTSDTNIACVLVPDTMNESELVYGTVAAIRGRTVIVPDLDGTEGGHVPSLLWLLGQANVVGGTSVAAKPYTDYTVPSLQDAMFFKHRDDTTGHQALISCMIDRRIYYATDCLHDLGIIPLMTASSLFPYATKEIATRTWRLASANKSRRGQLPGDTRNDNNRAKRYIAKYTINPAIAYGIQNLVGLIDPGLKADLAIWDPKSFGLTPIQVLKGGVPVLGNINDVSSTDESFVAIGPKTLDEAIKFLEGLKIKLRHSIVPIYYPPGKPSDMLHCTGGKIEVDPETLKVTLDGSVINNDVESVKETPLALNYA